MIYKFTNRNSQDICFEQLSASIIEMTGYSYLQVTGEPADPIAVDPSGGPMIEKGFDFEMLIIPVFPSFMKIQGNKAFNDAVAKNTPLTGIVKKITIGEKSVLFHVI